MELSSSIARLGAPEQACLHRLAREPGPFTLDRALDLLAADQSEQSRWIALETLQALVNHSQLVAGHGDPLQYDLPRNLRSHFQSE